MVTSQLLPIHLKRVVKLFGQQHSILNMITRGTEVGLNMCRVEHRYRVFACDRALIAVGIEQSKAKPSLTLTDSLRALIAPTTTIRLDELKAIGEFTRTNTCARADLRHQTRGLNRVVHTHPPNNVGGESLVDTPRNPARLIPQLNGA